MTSPGGIIFCDVDIPEINDNQVLIKIMRIGICGTDMHVYHGKHPFTPYPVVQGHEVSGRIEKIGRNVTRLKIGDKVTIQPQMFCGECYPCTHNSYHICDHLKVMGFQTTGMASEYFAADQKKVLKFSDSMSFEHGAMVEPLAVAVHALGRGGGAAGKKILVLGAGPVGNLVGQAAKGMGASEVMITDLSDYRLRLAKDCGIDHCVNVKTQDLGELLMSKFGADRADTILECVGVNSTIEQAILYARKGTDIIVVGVFGDKATVDLSLVQDRELRLIGTLMYQESDFLKAIELIEEGKVRLDPLVTDHFTFREYLKAYEYFEDQKDRVMKIMIEIG